MALIIDKEIKSIRKNSSTASDDLRRYILSFDIKLYRPYTLKASHNYQKLPINISSR